MDVHITEEDAAYEHHAATRFLIAGTATMNQRYSFIRTVSEFLILHSYSKCFKDEN